MGGYVALEYSERVTRLLARDIAPLAAAVDAGTAAGGAPVLASDQVLLGSPVLGRHLLTSGPEFVRALVRAGSGRGQRWTDEELDMYAEPLRDPARAAASSACYRTFLTR